MNKQWKTKESKYIVNDRWLKLRADTCETPEGHVIAPYYVLEKPEWVNCLVVNKDDTVTLLRHYRYAANKEVLEIIAGVVDEGETPGQTIERELEEEIGLTGAQITKLGSMYVNPADHTNMVHSFIAIGGDYDGKQINEAGASFSQVTIPITEFLDMIYSQKEVFQSLHLATVFLALEFLRRQGRVFNN